MDNATTFGQLADKYAAARPSYPKELYEWIGSQTQDHDLVWDVGTGSGQAAQTLTGYFKHVHATDIDAEQIASAAPHPKITYTQAQSHASGLQDKSVDAVTVATALHWFDHEKFWQELRRVAKPGALFCAWTYHRAETDPDVQETLIDPILDIIDDYWSEGNRLSWRGYQAKELGMPFTKISMPKFVCELSWTPLQISEFAQSWSAHHKASLDGRADALEQVKISALKSLDQSARRFILPLNTIAARVS